MTEYPRKIPARHLEPEGYSGYDLRTEFSGWEAVVLTGIALVIVLEPWFWFN